MNTNVYVSNTMKTEQKNWIEDIISSADAVHWVKADDALFTSVRQRLYSRVMQLKAVPARTVWAAAAGFVLLLSINFMLLRQTGNQPMAHNISPLTQNSFDIYTQP